MQKNCRKNRLCFHDRIRFFRQFLHFWSDSYESLLLRYVFAHPKSIFHTAFRDCTIKTVLPPFFKTCDRVFDVIRKNFNHLCIFRLIPYDTHFLKCLSGNITVRHYALRSTHLPSPVLRSFRVYQAHASALHCNILHAVYGHNACWHPSPDTLSHFPA